VERFEIPSSSIWLDVLDSLLENKELLASVSIALRSAIGIGKPGSEEIPLWEVAGWAVLCTNHLSHNRPNLFHRHGIPLGRNDAIATYPVMKACFGVHSRRLWQGVSLQA